MTGKKGPGRVVIVPPRPGACPVCAARHRKEEPHMRDSLYYQMMFHQEHGRFPTWEDAMQHCTETVKAQWRERLRQHGRMD